MPSWIAWASLALAVLGAVLGVVNTVTNYRRGSIRFRVETTVEAGQDDALRLTVKVVNAGRVPIRVGQVFLTGGRVGNAKRFELWRHDSYALFPMKLVGGQTETFTAHEMALSEPLMLDCFTVVAETEDGRRAKRVEPRLRLMRAQLQAAATTAQAVDQ